MVAQRQRDKTRAHAIRSAFLELLDERGLEETTLAEVARRAGVSPPLVHHHFRDKAALLHKALRERTGQVRTQLRDLSEHPLPPRERVLAMVNLFLVLATERATLAVWSAAVEAGRHDPSIRHELWTNLQRDLDMFGSALRELPATERVDRLEGGLLLLLSGALTLMVTAPNAVTLAALTAEARSAAALLLEGAASPRERPVDRVRSVPSQSGRWAPA